MNIVKRWNHFGNSASDLRGDRAGSGLEIDSEKVETNRYSIKEK